MHEIQSKKQRLVFGIILLILILIFAVLCFLLFRQTRNLHRQHILNSYRAYLFNRHTNATSTAAVVGNIQSWMTFDYINKLFKLSPAYLPQQLSLSDPHYPFVTLHSYAKRHGISDSTFVQSVQNAVSKYSAIPAQ